MGEPTKTHLSTVQGLEHPIDCIINTETHIIACGYTHEEGKRRGCVYFLDRSTLGVVSSVATSGSMHGCHRKGMLVVANTSDVMLFDKFTVVKIYTTQGLNTHVYIGDSEIYVSDTDGRITIFDHSLNLIDILKGSDHPIWVVREHKGFLYYGDEAGFSYRCDRENGVVTQIGVQRQGIIGVFIEEGKVSLSSYDENLEVYDLESLQLLQKFRKVGALWNMVVRDNLRLASCIYEGVKIFDCEYQQLFNQKTDSICYAACLDDKHDRLIWASFYSKSIEHCSFSKLLANTSEDR